ncbi:MAG: hypothetical protein EZS28_001712 [Streblomastix strix]|uniref:Uncharacterized protein n=1 Tax=Streblomastix strix TaxID=222440 RepID=A0A5J4X6F6_9EUKA|nr:MAG: hypothetical protein EZS28_001712 [Streblomastix strix]
MDSSRIQLPTILDELQSIKKELHDLQNEGKRLSYLNIAYENQINAIQSDYIRQGQAVELEKRLKTWIDANISRSSEEIQMTQMEQQISKRVLLQTQQFINEGNTKKENETAKRLNQETSNTKDDVKRSIEQMKQWQKMLELQIEQLQTQFGSISVQLQETTHRIEQSQTQQQTQMQIITQSINKIKQQKSAFYDHSGLNSDNIQQLSPNSTPSKYQSSSPSTISELFKDLQLINSPISIINQTLLKHNDSPFRIDQNQTQRQQTNYTYSSSQSLAVNAQFENLNKQIQNMQAQLDAISSDICKGRQKQNQIEAQIFGIEDRLKDLERRVIFM